MIGRIYYLTDDTNIPRYVGATTDKLINRKNAHRSNSKTSKKITHKINWIRSVGYNISIFLIEECEVDKLYDREIYWIDTYSNLYNLTNGTKGGEVGHKGYKGRKCSDETKKKLSKANKGRVITNEWKSKISKSCKGIPKSEEAKIKISKTRLGEKHPHKGHPTSDEVKNKLSKANKGRIYTEEEKELMKNKKKLLYVTCPYCGLHTSKTNAIRWHFDNCKLKNI
jgi:group I intron endonuclease